MSVVGLDHAFITIPSGAEDESRRFYGELLGLKEIPKPAGLGTPGVWFQAGNQELHLGAYEDHAAPKRPHPGSRVESATALEELAHRLDEAGVEPKWDDRIEGRKRFYVRDPFGSRVELLTDL
ncbi:MAG TPA: VOC family protein [Gaiellaceae bacterium]|jgi:catechol 2,3-dioxygenase-like lactoylglutathione lyase family enzyme|nr:VOC family protein [Gaiellaceae bacterium]